MAVVADVHEDGEVRLASGCSINGALAQVLQKSGAWEKGKICGLVVGVLGPDRAHRRTGEVLRVSNTQIHLVLQSCRAAVLQCCPSVPTGSKGLS